MASAVGHVALGSALHPFSTRFTGPASDKQKPEVVAHSQWPKPQNATCRRSSWSGTPRRSESADRRPAVVCMCAPDGSSQPSKGSDFPEVEKLTEKDWANLQAEADQMLDSEESKAMLRDLEAAAKRVSDARAALDEIARQEREVMEARFRLETMAAHEADVASADAVTRDCERQVSEAEAELQEASIALVKARAGIAGQSDGSDRKWESEDIDEALERVESGKAAAIAGLAGAMASLPFLLATTTNPFSLGTLISEGAVVATCVLFGVTYRYVVRRDVGNTQLKGGAVGAFALARGLAQVDTTQALVGFPEAGVAEVLKAALNAGESVLVLGFAAVALDYCLRDGRVAPFPSRRKTD